MQAEGKTAFFRQSDVAPLTSGGSYIPDYEGNGEHRKSVRVKDDVDDLNYFFRDYSLGLRGAMLGL